jgi:F-type H+-transporting ATPase subunit delta
MTLKGTGAARRYAKALVDLATHDDRVAETGEQLRVHRDLFRADASLRSLLLNPSFDRDVKARVVTAILDRTQPSPLVRNFLLVLLKNDRLQDLVLIDAHYERLANHQLGRVMAQVITAVELEDEQYASLEQKVAAATQKHVMLDKQIDPSILGGVIVKIDHTVLDGSLRGRLQRLRRELVGG